MMIPTTVTPSSSSRLASLARRAAHGFAPNTFVAGYQLVKESKVTLDVRGPDSVEATVGDAPRRAVRVRAVGDELALACACMPTSLDEVPFCKHAWAVLLEADRRDDVFARLRSTTAPIAVVRLPEDASNPGPPSRAAEKEKEKGKENAPPKPDRGRADARTRGRTETANPPPAPGPPAKPKEKGKGETKTKGETKIKAETKTKRETKTKPDPKAKPKPPAARDRRRRAA